MNIWHIDVMLPIALIVLGTYTVVNWLHQHRLPDKNKANRLVR